MLGATDTTSGPDVAPVGMLIDMDVLLHVLTVTAAPFRSTRLLPWDWPKPFPVTVTWVPTGPVVADSVVIVGAGVVGVLTDI
jgi:hypothetical protein